MTQGQSSRAKVLASKGAHIPSLHKCSTASSARHLKPAYGEHSAQPPTSPAEELLPSRARKHHVFPVWLLSFNLNNCYTQYLKHTQNMLYWCIYRTFYFQSSRFWLPSLLNPLERLSKNAVQKSAVSFSQTIKLLPVTWELNICYLATGEAIWERTPPLPLSSCKPVTDPVTLCSNPFHKGRRLM